MTYFLGLTGGIACGKSTASKYFKSKGIPIIDADIIAHNLMEKGQENYLAIKKIFGSSVLELNQDIDNNKLGKIVFSDPKKMTALNKATHPIILKIIKNKMSDYKLENEPIVILDVPLLFETNYDSLCTETLVITLDYSLQIKRLMERNNYSYYDAKARIDSQMPLIEKEKRATYTLNNAGSKSELEAKLARFLVKISR